MARWEIDKAALGHLLDALRLGLDDLRVETISRDGNTSGSVRNGAQTYAHLRRLRTYVQGFATGVGEAAVIELSEDNQNLLAASCLLEVGKLDRALAVAGRREQSELERLEERRTLLASWCVRLATRRIESLTVAAGRQNTATLLEIRRDVQRRLMSTPGGDRHELIRDLSTDLRAAPSLAGRPPSEPPLGVPSTRVASRPAPPTPADPVAAARLHAGVSPTVPPLHQDLPLAAMRTTGVLSFDVRHILDPRLRAMLQLDVAAHGRAVEAQDYRLAMAHLASIIEAAVIDLGLANRQRFALGGSPEAWSIDSIVTRLLENHFTPVNPNALRFLGLARTILRPAHNLSAAVVITPAIRAEFEEFAYRILTAVAASRDAD